MFNRETENRIIDFIKKSPIGASSTEIAKSVGLNRMTITKYLAIIKEKTLIDFKQFGMAKLWYIPVKLNKESFLSKFTTFIVSNLSKEDLKNLLDKAGIGLGEEINEMYLKFYNMKKLTNEKLCDAYNDIGKKLGGSFKAKPENEKISVEIAQNPFNEENRNSMNTVLSALFAKIASLNLGYARSLVINSETEGNVVIDVYLKKK